MKLTKEFINNDIYFMEIALDKIVINDNYDGILILDREFNIVKTIKLFDDIVIDTSFVKGKEIVLCCYDNRCLVYLNVETFKYTVISLSPDLYDITFLSLYEWKDNDLILLAENGTVFLCVNMSTYTVNKVQIDFIEKLSFSINNDWEQLSKSIVHKVYPDRQIAVIEIDNILKIINYKNGAQSVFNIERINFHDIEVTENFVAQICEFEVSISYGVKNVKLYPLPEGYVFWRCKFLSIDGMKYLLLLVCNDADSSMCKLERYSLEEDLFT